jgi:hypothetical protein
MMKKNLFINTLIVTSILLLPVSNVFAEHNKYKNRISFGGFIISKYDSEIGLTSADSGVGATVDPSQALGVNNEQSVFRLDGHYRFNDNHSLVYSWYSIKSTGNRTINEEIPWEPDPIPIGAKIDSTINYDLYKVGYLWSFHNGEKVELGVGAGLHITRLGVELAAETTGTPLQTESVNTTVPLPVVMFKLGYKITPDMTLTYLSQVFAIEFEGISGTYSDQAIALEYRFWKNIALGLGVNNTSLSIKQEKDSRILSYNNRITGGMVFISGYF